MVILQLIMGHLFTDGKLNLTLDDNVKTSIVILKSVLNFDYFSNILAIKFNTL